MKSQNPPGPPPGVSSADGCINIPASSCRGENDECLSVLLDFGSGMEAALSLKEKGCFLKEFVNEMKVCRGPDEF